MEGEERGHLLPPDQDDAEELRSIVPAKRKTSVDIDSLSHTSDVRLGDAHRAYIAHAAPHLLQSSSPTVQASHKSHDSPSVSPTSAHPHSPIASPFHSTQASRSSPEDERGHASSSRNTASPMPQNRSLLTESSPARQKRSHHLVPKRFRGPLPMFGDAEDLGPMPQLVPAQGFAEMYNVNNYPVNRNGWRYVAAGPASHTLPLTIYKTLETEPNGVHWSWSDRSVFTHLSSDACTVAATNGFRSARANIPVRQGSWYVEIHILEPQGPTSDPKDGHHVRLGWARREAGLNAPVGSTGYSYGMRDTTGEKVFLSRTYPYGEPFKAGDVVGMWISLPSSTSNEIGSDSDRIERKRIPIRYRGRLYFEQLEYVATKEMDCLMARSRKGEKLASPRGPLANERAINPQTGLLAMPKKDDSGINGKPRKLSSGPPGTTNGAKAGSNLRPLPTLGPESQIGFFINGKPQGIAFENLLDFRPLRRHRKDVANASTLKVKVNSSRGLSDKPGSDEEEKVDVITTHSTAASVLKSRENHYDDGALGYFPFISLFGNARARLVSNAEEFAYPPPTDVQQALVAADEARENERNERAHRQGADVPCRALGQRYAEFMQEMWTYDCQDEEKEQRKADLRKDESSSSEDEAMPATGKSSTKKGSKKKANNVRRTASSTPAPETSPSSPASTLTQQMLKPESANDADVTLKMEEVMETSGNGIVITAERPFDEEIGSEPLLTGGTHDVNDMLLDPSL